MTLQEYHIMMELSQMMVVPMWKRLVKNPMMIGDLIGRKRNGKIAKKNQIRLKLLWRWKCFSLVWFFFAIFPFFFLPIRFPIIIGFFTSLFHIGTTII